jgi:hypothetical protein
MAMRPRLLAPGVLALVLLVPHLASAITVDQVVSLAKAGVTDTVILALIDRDRTVFAIEPEQIVSLQRNGLSEKVILAMLKSGRAEGEQAARADAAYNSAWIASGLATEPEMVSVGHGPDRPNTPHIDGFYSGPPASAFSPYSAPGFRYRAPSFGSRRSGEFRGRASEPRALCYAQINSRTSTSAPFVTECPAVMQPHRR